MSLLFAFLVGVYQIDHEESENHGSETQGSILKVQGLKAPSK